MMHMRVACVINDVIFFLIFIKFLMLLFVHASRICVSSCQLKGVGLPSVCGQGCGVEGALGLWGKVIGIAILTMRILM